MRIPLALSPSNMGTLNNRRPDWVRRQKKFALSRIKMGVHLTLVTIAWLLSFASGAIPTVVDQARLVHTRLGTVAGVRLKLGESTVDAYLGIPFAEPPVGEKRFRRPTPAAPWKGVLNATRQNPGCVQTDLPITGNISLDMSDGTEDCLYLNVWVPQRPCGTPNAKDTCEKALPVFVYLYGGFFGWGATSIFIYDGVYFSSRAKVITVTLNYRVNALGFLNASSPEAPGNMGMYDQVEALRWIRNNIRSFGGDPDMVTLAGHSAGAISTGYHMMSDLSKGLFKRGVLLSGSPSSLAYSEIVDPDDNLRRISHVFQCTDNSKPWDMQVSNVISCLRKQDAQVFVDRLFEELKFRYLALLPGYGDTFLPHSPIDYKSAKFHVKEVFLGTTRDEGALAMVMFAMRSGLRTEDVDGPTAMRLTLKFLFNMGVSESRVFVEEYLSGDSYGDRANVLSELSAAINDAGFQCTADIFATATTSQNAAVYRGLFDHRPSLSIWPDWVPATHNDDVSFYLGTIHSDPSVVDNKQTRALLSLFRSLPTPEEYEFSDDLVDALGEFCKTG